MFASTSTAYIVVFVLGVLGVTTEFRYQTITPTVLVTPSRWAVVTAKMITYAIVGVLYALACVVTRARDRGAVAVGARTSTVDYGDPDVAPRDLRGVRSCVALFGHRRPRGRRAAAQPDRRGDRRRHLPAGAAEHPAGDPRRCETPGRTLPGGATQAILHTTGTTEVTDGVHLLSAGGGVVVLLLWAFVPAILGRGDHDEPRHHLTGVALAHIGPGLRTRPGA